MLATTTPTIEGKRITKYYGIVTGETIIGANLFRDFFASIRDIVGGRSGSYEEVLRQAKDTALREMQLLKREKSEIHASYIQSSIPTAVSLTKRHSRLLKPKKETTKKKYSHWIPLPKHFVRNVSQQEPSTSTATR